jgi:hypothetical protein
MTANEFSTYLIYGPTESNLRMLVRSKSEDAVRSVCELLEGSNYFVYKAHMPKSSIQYIESLIDAGRHSDAASAVKYCALSMEFVMRVKK